MVWEKVLQRKQLLKPRGADRASQTSYKKKRRINKWETK